MKLKGFSLWELLIVLALLGAMLLMASPSWGVLSRRNQLTSITESLLSGVRYARRTAIASAEKVALCGSADHLSCDGAWGVGQLVVSESGAVLRRFPAVPEPYRLIWRSSFSRNDRLVFTPSGFTDGQQGSFYICSSSEGKRVVVAETGRVRLDDKIAGCLLG